MVQQHGFDGADDGVEVVQNGIVREAEDAEALGLEAAGAVGVFGDGDVVGGAVDHDHQAGGEADEVDDM